MSQEDLAERLDAVERRLDAAYPEPTDGAAPGDRTIERLETFAERLADLEAAVEAVEGYVGEIERVDGDLEQRADAAIAAAEGAEERVEAVGQRVDGLADRLDSVEARSGAPPSADELEALRGEIAEFGDRLAEIEAGSAGASRDVARGGSSDGADAPDRPEASPAETPRSGTGRGGHRPCDCDDPGAAGDLDGSASVGNGAVAQDGGGWTPDHRANEPPEGRSTRPRSAGSTPGNSPLGDPGTPPDAPGSRRDVSADRPDPVPPHARDEGAQAAPIGRADGGRPERREVVGGSSDDPTISGWDDPDGTPTSEPPGRSRQGDGRREDRSWASARSETLLDRLRSLL